MLNSIADLFANDTQLVESVNSLVRLIGVRCPRIDLSAMSARIMCKKSVLPAGPVEAAARKRWSSVKAYAEPLLVELVQSGDGYKTVLGDTVRFTPLSSSGISCASLHEMLGNEDMKVAFPDQETPRCLMWSHAFVLQWKRATDKLNRDRYAKLASEVSMTGIVLTTTEHDNADDHDSDIKVAYVRAASCRTRILVAAFECGSVP